MSPVGRISLFLDRIPIVLQITAVVSLVLVAVLAGSLMAVSHALTASVRETAGSHLESVALELADRLDRGIYERYLDIALLAASEPFRRLDEGDASAVEPWIERLQDLNALYAWIGLASPDGLVLQGSDDLLEGESVAAQPWFVGANEGPYIGNVREDRLLGALLQGGSASPGEPLRLVDIAVPVVNANGELAGVLGAHVSWDWARDLREAVLTARRREMQTGLTVLDRHGRLILGGPFGSDLSALPSVRAALEGRSGWAVEVLDGVPHLIGYAPTHGIDALLDLGWIVLASTPLAVADAPLAQLNRDMVAAGAALGLLGVLAVFLTANRLGRPLSRLTAIARRIDRDTPRTLPRLSGSREVVGLSLALRALLHRIGTVTERLEDSQERNRSLEMQRAELERLARLDPLTGLSNRRAFLELAGHEIARARRDGTPLAVLMIDIDHFKAVNDTYGHAVGDEVIRAVATMIRNLARDSDLVARFGGEEFVVLLPNCSFADARAFGERLRAGIAATPVRHGEEALSVTVSVGCAEFNPSASGIEEAIDIADHALYIAKQSGRNRVEAAATRAVA